VALEIDPGTGRLAYSEVDIVMGRQQGKTELLLPAMTHRCTAFDAALVRWIAERYGLALPAPDPQTVLYTAQTADKAREKWRDVHLPRLNSSRHYRHLFHARLQRNSEAFLWRNMSRWSPGSTTAKTSGTGDTLDMPVIDEAWSRESMRTEAGLRPAMLTRKWRQLWVCSMIPGLSKAAPGSWPYLTHKRQIGQARADAGVTEGVAYFEWSADENMDPTDPATWWTCMPALGHTIDERAVRDDLDAMDLVDFCAEYLGWAPMDEKPRWSVIPRDTWVRFADPGSYVLGRPALAVEIAEDRSQAWIGSVGKRADGQWHVEIIEPGYKIAPGAAGTSWVEPRLFELIDTHKPVTTVVDPRRPAASLIVALKNRGHDVLTPNAREIAAACGRFYDRATGENDENERVWHLGQPELDRALAAAKTWDLGEGLFTFVRKGTASIISPLYLVVLGMLGIDVKGTETTPEPDLFI
jgi:hypothetical protein